jgi:maltooligosyltrehalose trehalohydrolase
MTEAFAWPLPFGATWRAGAPTRFRLWAPAQTEVAVAVEGGSPVAMRRTSDGWFEAEVPCDEGAAYRYRLGSGLAVPDPASRAQHGDVHGPSLVVDPTRYRWCNAGWRGRPWHEAVIYELHAGLFGGFAGVQAALPRLAEVGVTALELMPINAFSGARNWGYDGVLPFAPAQAYGTPDELKSLIDQAHGHRLMMFLDVVYNHFGPDGNYLASYAPGFFRDDVHTPWGVAIDFRRPEVRRFFIENALYWLQEYRFDGLRFDAVHAIADPTFLDDMADEIRRTVEPGRHVHLVLENEENDAGHLRHGYDAQWNDDIHHCLHVLLTDEHESYYEDYAADTAVKLARCLKEGFAYQGEASRHRGGKPRGTPSGDLAPTAFVVALQNHDQIGNRPFGDRLNTLANPAALRAAVALQLLAPGIPLIFMGEEVFAEAPFQFFTDYHGELAQAVREGRRREFARFAGFAKHDVPDPNATETFERSRLPGGDVRGEDGDFYRRLLEIRHREIVPRLPGTRAINAVAVGPAAVLARWRLGDGAVLTLATNLSLRPASGSCPEGEILFATGEFLGAHSTVALLAGP